VLFAVALTFTRSRLGIVCGLGGVVVSFALLQRRVRRFRAAQLISAVWRVVVVACLAAAPGRTRFAARFDSLESRCRAAALGVWREHLTSAAIGNATAVAGSGFGSFLFTFPEYQTSFPHAEFAEAHNDFLQIVWGGAGSSAPCGRRCSCASFLRWHRAAPLGTEKRAARWHCEPGPGPR